MDVRSVGGTADSHCADCIAIKPNVVARDKCIGPSERETIETGLHVEGSCSCSIVERAAQCYSLFSIKNEVGSKTGCGSPRVKIKIGIEGHIALGLAVIDKVLDIDGTATIA